MLKLKQTMGLSGNDLGALNQTLNSKIDFYDYQDTVIDGVPSRIQNDRACWDLEQLSYKQQTLVKLFFQDPQFWLLNAYPAFQKYGDNANKLLYTGDYGFYAYVCRNRLGGT